MNTINPPRYIFTEEEKKIQREIATLRARIRDYIVREKAHEPNQPKEWFTDAQVKLEGLLVQYKAIKLKRALEKCS